MKNYRSLITAIAASTIVSSLNADTFILSDGTKIEGEIVSTSVDSYVIRAQVSPGIRNNKTVKRIDVEKIIKEDKSVSSYEAIKDTLPAPDLLAPEDYQRVIDEKLNPFLQEFPNSEHAPAVEKMKATLESEMKLIKNGGVKLDGKIITPAQRAANQYEIDARLQYAQMSHFAKSRAFAPALQKFEILEEDYKGTTFFNQALELAKQILPAYKADLTKMSQEAEGLVEKRRITLDRLDSGNRLRSEKILEQEDADYQKRLADAREARMKWLPNNRFDKEQIDDNLRTLEREEERINRLETSEVDAGAAYRDIISHLDKNELNEANDRLRDFRSARAPSSYTDALQQRIEKVKETIRELEAEKQREAEEEARKAQEEQSNG